MNSSQQISAIIAEVLKVPSASITPEAKLLDLAPDSIALFELLLRFESMLGRRIAYEEIANVETVGDIMRFSELLPAEVLSMALGQTKSPTTSAAA